MAFLDFIASSHTALTISIGVLGLFIGSFLNVVIHRLPIMLDREWKQAATDILDQNDSLDNESSSDTQQEPAYNLVVPRSACPNCGHQITALENIPIFSYLFLRGRCSDCNTRISPRYPLVEFATGLLFAATAAVFGYSNLLAPLLCFVSLLIVLTLIDIDTQLLPDNLVYPLLWIGLVVNLSVGLVPLKEAVIGALAGYLSLWLVFWGFKLSTGKEGMGYGDFKLFAALGAWFGWQSLVFIILMASVVGAVLGILMILTTNNERNTRIPFGPYLCMAGLIYLFFGSDIISLYYSSMGLR